MTQTRFTCTLTKTDEPACQSYARVTIEFPEACPAEDDAPVAGGPIAYVEASAPTQDSLGHAELATD